MKKGFSIFILALLLVSIIPVVFAEDSATVGVNVDTSVDTSNDKASASGSASANSRLAVQEKIRQFKEARLQAQGNRQEIREDRQEVRADYKEEVQAFKELRMQLLKCKGSDTDTCAQVKLRIKAQSKEHLLKTADKILELLNRLKERVQNSKIEDKTTLIADIDAGIKKINDEKTKINALPENPTADQIKETAKELRQTWVNVRKTIKLGAEASVNFGVKGVLVRAEMLQTRLDTTLAKLKAEGKDTTQAEASVQAFKDHIAKAKDLAAQAKAKFEAARNSQEADFDAQVKAGHDLLIQARAELKLAQQSLREAVVSIKGLTGGKEELEKETNDVETKAEVELSANA